MGGVKIPPEFQERIEVTPEGCWQWTGWIAGIRGTTGATAPYPVFQRNKRQIRVHRYFYELGTGEDLGRRHVHHTCRNTLCVNPAHLKALTASDHNRLHDALAEVKEALRAKTHCKNGHAFADGNFRLTLEGYRICRLCIRNNMRKHRSKVGGKGPKKCCIKGHPFAGDNLYLTPQGRRVCRTCFREQQQRYRDKKKDKNKLAEKPPL